MRRFSPLLIGFVVAIVCIRLGMWQLSRLGQRRAHNARIENREAEPRLSLDALAIPESLTYRRAEGRGTWDFDREVVVQGRSLDGAPGIYVVTPLVLHNGLGVLVERGWTYAPDARTVSLAAARELDTTTVEGVFQPLPPPAWVTPVRADTGAALRWPIRVRAADPGALGPAFPYALLPLVLRRTNPPLTAPGMGARLRPIPLPALDNGPHLSYAMQWFSFAVIALVGSIVLYRKETMGARDPV